MIKLIKLTLGFLFITSPTQATVDGSGWVQVTYLTKILSENMRRHQQLEHLLRNGNEYKDLLKKLHSGLDEISSLAYSLPVQDEKILSQIKTFSSSIRTVQDIYGKIPTSDEEIVHRLHDNTVAESLRMIHGFKEFAKNQESNSLRLSSRSRLASPKGAARIAASTNAEILKSLAQIIRLNSQMLKLQGEQLAFANKRSKDEVLSYQRVNENLESSFKNLELGSNLPRF